MENIDDKTEGMEVEESFVVELILYKRFACNIVSGISFVLCGIVLLLMGLNVIPLKIMDAALPTILLTLGIVFIITSIIQLNSASLWLSFFLIIPAIIILIATYSDLKYSELYPFFILIPAIASLFTTLMSRERKIHYKIAAFFIFLSILFSLQSFGIVGWEAVIPVLIVFIGIIILIRTIFGKKTTNDLD